MKKRMQCITLTEQEWLGNVIAKKLDQASTDEWVTTVAQIIAEELETQVKGHYSYISTDSLTSIQLNNTYDLISLVARLKELGLLTKKEK